MGELPLLGLINTSPPSDPTRKARFEKLYINIVAASLLAADWFDRHGTVPTSIGSAGAALRSARKNNRGILDLFANTTNDLKQFLAHLEQLETDNSKPKSLINNVITPWRRLLQYACARKKGKRAHSKDSLSSAISLTFGGSGDISSRPPRVLQTRYNDDSANSHTPARENSYFTPSATYVEHPRTDRSQPGARCSTLQHKVNKRINQSLVMGQLLSATHPKSLSPYIVATIKSECLKQLKNPEKIGTSSWKNSLFILLSLVFGRPVRLIKGFKHRPIGPNRKPKEVCWVKIEEKWYLYDKIRIPREHLPDHIEDNVTNELFPHKESLGCLLPVPRELEGYLDEYLSGTGEDAWHLPENEGQTLRGFSSLKHRQVTLSKIAAHLSLSLRHAGVDSVIQGHICGTGADETPALFYAQVSPYTVISCFNDYVESLGFETESDAPIDGVLGSLLVPHSKRIFSHFQEMRAEIQKLDANKPADVFNHHNLLTLYTYMLLCLATGHRPVTEPFEYLRDFDLEAGFVWICDKVVRTNHSSRVVPLCETALEQMLRYLDHLKNLEKKLMPSNNALAHFIGDVLASCQPLFFLFTNTGPQSLSPQVLKHKDRFISPLPQNWQRHQLRSALTGNTWDESINAFMGHALIGVGAMSCTSGYNFANLKTIGHQVQSMLDERGIIPIGASPHPHCIGAYHPPKKQKGAIGRRKRAKNRETSRQIAIRKYDLLEIDLNFNGASITSAEQYERALKDIEAKIEDLNLTAEALVYIKGKLLRTAQKIVRTNKLHVSLPQVPTRLTFESSFRNEQWFSSARYIHVWERLFKDRLNVITRSSYEDEKTLIGLILYSAIVHGGLTDLEMVKKLAGTLSKSGPTLQRMGPYAWLELRVEAVGQRSRYSMKLEDERCYRHRHWFPDAISLALIRRLCRRKKEAPEQKPLKVGLQTKAIFVLIQKAVFAGTPNKTSITKLDQLTAAGFWSLESRQKIEISEALQSLASNHFRTFSVSPEAWRSLFSPLNEVNQVSARLPRDERAARGNILKKDPNEWGTFYDRELLPAITPPSFENGKITTGQAVANLKFLRGRDNLPVHLRLAIDWLIEVALRKDNSPATLQRYCSNLVLPLIYETNGEVPDLQDEVYLQELYTNMQTFHTTQGETDYLMGRLADFHSFAMKDRRYRLPELETLPWHKRQRHTRVRTRILSIGQVRKAIDVMLQNEPSMLERRKIALYVTLAFRTGMRLGELAKLRVCEVEKSDDFVVTVRNNPYGDNKSKAGHRRIHLSAFLDEDELKEFRLLMNHKTASKKHLLKPLFDKNDTGIPYKPSAISKMFSMAMKALTNDDDIVFHNLRHSCFSCLHATLEGVYEVSQDFTGLSIEQLRNIRTHLMGHASNRMGLYYTLAAFAGHADPRETMTSYLHLTDLILFQKLQKQSLIVGFDKLAQIAGVQGKRLNGRSPQEQHEYLVTQPIAGVRDHRYKPLTIPPFSLGSSDELSIESEGPDLTLTNTILRLIEEGSRSRDVADQFGIEHRQVEEWIQKARVLQQLTTRRGNKRLQPHNNSSILTVKAPNDKSVRLELANVLETIPDYLGSMTDQEIAEFTLMVLKASSPSARSYRLHQPEQISNIVDFFAPMIPKSRWQFIIGIPDGTDRETTEAKWRKTVPRQAACRFNVKDAIISPQFPDGIAFMHLVNPIGARYSSLPKIVAYLAAIAYCDIDDLAALVETADTA